jgi:hypothetical protein
VGFAVSPVWEKHMALGGPTGFLGKPTTGETTAPDGVGHFLHCEGGSIYWKPSTCAHEIHGAIEAFWAARGYERNPDLGYPISDQQRADPANPANKNHFSDFENGVLYWSASNDKVQQLLPVAPALIESFTRTADKPGFDTSEEGIAALIKQEVERSPGVTVEEGPNVTVDDYECDAGETRNRRYRTTMRVKVSVGCLFFSGWVKTGVEFVVSINFDRTNRKINAWLVSGKTTGEAEFSFLASRSASANQKAVDNRVDSLVRSKQGQPLQELTIPRQSGKFGVNVLSVKIARDGELQVFIEPVCLLMTAATLAVRQDETDEALRALQTFRDDAISPLPRSSEVFDRYNVWAPTLVGAIDEMPDAQEIYGNVYDELVVAGAGLAEAGELNTILMEDYPLVLDLIDGIESRPEPSASYELLLEQLLPTLRQPRIIDGLRGLLRDLCAQFSQS